MRSHKGEELELLALVHADFACDEPRLRYADWLEREGRGEEAELIRLQCDPEANPERTAELLAIWEPRWREGFEWLSPPYRLDRGFLCPRSNLYLHYERSDELSRTVEGMLGNRGLFWCEDLHLGYSTGLAAGLAGKLADAPYACNIARLELHEVRLPPAELVELLRLPSLAQLDLRGGFSADWGGAEYTFPSVSDEEVQELLASPHIGKLKCLTLDHQNIWGTECQKLRAALPQNVELSVDGKSY